MSRNFNRYVFPFQGENFPFELDDQYHGIEIINRGAQGVIIKCYDYLTQKNVAIKKIQWDKNNPEKAKQLYREFVISKHVDHVNLIKLLDGFSPNHRVHMRDVYMVYDLMECSLRDLMARPATDPLNIRKMVFDANSGCGFTMDFLYQLFCGVQYLHQDNLKVIHRDLKPANILVKQMDSSLLFKICDYGLSRHIENDVTDASMYVVTWPYRAPEVQLLENYRFPVDIWSLGCILAEVLMGKMLFERKSPLDLFCRILYIVGYPPNKQFHPVIQSQLTEQYGDCKLDRLFSDDKLPNWVNPRWTKNNVRWLLKRLLDFTPETRISADELVNSLLFDGFMRHGRNLVAGRELEPMEAGHRSVEEWQSLISQELEEHDNNRFNTLNSNFFVQTPYQ